ncbi:MAG TPA: HAD family hydrolase [Fimbriimonadaceae bacterium]|nr:HAD family hydrolase [Fimbriimonadaceae bacterium]
MSNERIKAVLFDVDGTLVDSLEMLAHGLGDTYEHYLGYRPNREALTKIMGRSLRSIMSEMRAEGGLDASIEEMSAFTVERYDAKKHLVTEFGPAIEALELCFRGGLGTALVTSKNTPEFESFIHTFRGSPFCTTWVISDHVKNPKPDAESALLACERLGVRPDQAAFIGDSVFDMRCARSAGCYAIAVLYGSGRRDDLLAEQPDLVLETPEDVLRWSETTLNNQDAKKEIGRTA